jgi:hypothetical protein
LKTVPNEFCGEASAVQRLLLVRWKSDVVTDGPRNETVQ